MKRWCKRPPGYDVNRNARKALSGAMPNRKARVGPTLLLSGRQLKLVFFRVLLNAAMPSLER